jgi:shikimate kinase
MAMAFAVAGTKLNGIEIENPEVVAKTFPNFWKSLASLGVGIENSDEKNIILIGMRGSGKSTILKLLAKELKIKYLDVDDLIVSNIGMSISEIVQKDGWEYFRDIESKVIKSLYSTSGTVIATGGGSVVRRDNVQSLKKNGIFVFLEAGVDLLLKRNKKPSKKPRLTNKKTIEEEIQTVLEERKNLYKKLADITVSVDGKKSKDIVAEIIAKLRQKSVELKAHHKNI